MNNNSSNNNTLPKELENCNFVKTVLMMIVIFYHSILFWNGDWFTKNPAIESKFLANLSQWLNSFHIYAFTLVSGYIFYYLKFEKGKYNNFKQYAFSKFKRLIVPYISLSIIWVIPISLYFLKDLNTTKILVKFIFGTEPGQLWFLLMLFNVFMLAYPLSYLFKKYIKTSIFVVSLIYLLGSVMSKFILDYFQIWKSCRFLLFFFLGFQLRNLKLDLNKFPWYIFLLFNIILYWAFVYLCSRSINYASVINIILHIEGSLTAFIILQKLANYLFWQTGIFQFFTSSSMIIYLFHQQIVCITVYSFNGLLNPFLHGLLNFLTAIMFCSIISYFILKFNFTCFLVGEKWKRRY